MLYFYIYPSDPKYHTEDIFVPAVFQYEDVNMKTQVFIPSQYFSHEQYPVVIFIHGRPISDREKLKPILYGHVRYWQKLGFAVVAPIRPGYGESGGLDRENCCNYGSVFLPEEGLMVQHCIDTGTLFDDLNHAVTCGVAAVSSTIQWVRQQRWANRNKILIVGQSVGGLIAVAVGALNIDGSDWLY